MMNFKSLWILSFTLFAFPALATDVETANSLFKDFGKEIQQVLNLREIAKNEVQAWYTSADHLQTAHYCRTGYFGGSSFQVGVPFKIGRQAACLKSFKKMGLELDERIDLKSWEYLFRAYALPESAEKTLSSLGVIVTKSSEQSKCFHHLRKLVIGMSEISNYYLDPLSDSLLGQQMNAIQALDFLKNVMKDGRKFSEYLVYEDASPKELISRGREIHLAVKVLRMSLYNDATPEYTKMIAQQLSQGCEI